MIKIDIVNEEFLKYIETEALELQIVSTVPFKAPVVSDCNDKLVTSSREEDTEAGHAALLQEFNELKEKIAVAESKESESVKTLCGQLEEERQEKEALRRKMEELEKKLARHPKSKVCNIL